MSINARNPIYSSENQDAIDVEYEHHEHGWIPFTARHDDVEELGRQIYEMAKRGGFGAVAPYSPPPAPASSVPHQVTRRQGRLALHQAGKLQAVEAAIGEDIEARIEYEADTWERDNAFLQSMWAQLGGTESELDDLFILASGK